MKIGNQIKSKQYKSRQVKKSMSQQAKVDKLIDTFSMIQDFFSKYTEDAKQTLNLVDNFKNSILLIAQQSIHNYFSQIQCRHQMKLNEKDKAMKTYKQKNQRINNQVLQLKMMFDEALLSYRNQIQIKEEQIKRLKECIQQINDERQLKELEKQTRKSIIDSIDEDQENNDFQIQKNMKEGRLQSINEKSRAIKQDSKMRVSTFLKSQFDEYTIDNLNHQLSVIEEVEQATSTTRSQLVKQTCELETVEYYNQASNQNEQVKIIRSSISQYFSSQQSLNQEFSAQLITKSEEERRQIISSTFLPLANRQSQCLSLLQKKKLLQKSFEKQVLNKSVTNQNDRIQLQKDQQSKDYAQQFRRQTDQNTKQQTSPIIVNDSSICTEMQQQSHMAQIQQSDSCKVYSIKDESIFSHSLNSQKQNQSKTDSFQSKSKQNRQNDFKISEKITVEKQQRKRCVKTQYADREQTKILNTQHKRYYSFADSNQIVQNDGLRANNFIKRTSDTNNIQQSSQKRVYSNDCIRNVNIVSMKIKNTSTGFNTYFSQGKIKYDKENIKPQFSNQKAISRSNSKEKSLNITKMMRQLKYGDSQSYQNFKKHKKGNLSNIGSFNNSVSIFNKQTIGSLGDKQYLKSLKNNIKQIFGKFKLWQAQEQFTYQGSIKKGLKQGYGILTFTDGIVYQGYFSKNRKHGKGKVVMNGVTIFEGEFFNDKIQGQGYVKSLKLFTTNISTGLAQTKALNKVSAKESKFLMKKPERSQTQPGIVFQLRETAYSGMFLNNMMHGNGIIYLNSRQKIACKFERGVPYGQLTYYNDENIQFGSWQS